jgi:hypothetical protein
VGGGALGGPTRRRPERGEGPPAFAAAAADGGWWRPPRQAARPPSKRRASWTTICSGSAIPAGAKPPTRGAAGGALPGGRAYSRGDRQPRALRRPRSRAKGMKTPKRRVPARAGPAGPGGRRVTPPAKPSGRGTAGRVIWSSLVAETPFATGSPGGASRRRPGSPARPGQAGRRSAWRLGLSDRYASGVGVTAAEFTGSCRGGARGQILIWKDHGERGSRGCLGKVQAQCKAIGTGDLNPGRPVSRRHVGGVGPRGADAPQYARLERPREDARATDTNQSAWTLQVHLYAKRGRVTFVGGNRAPPALRVVVAVGWLRAAAAGRPNRSQRRRKSGGPLIPTRDWVPRVPPAPTSQVGGWWPTGAGAPWQAGRAPFQRPSCRRRCKQVSRVRSLQPLSSGSRKCAGQAVRSRCVRPGGLDAGGPRAAAQRLVRPWVGAGPTGCGAPTAQRQWRKAECGG